MANVTSVTKRVIGPKIVVASKGKGRSSKKLAQANVTKVDKISNGVDNINLSAVVFEVNLVGNLKEW